MLEAFSLDALREHPDLAPVTMVLAELATRWPILDAVVGVLDEGVAFALGVGPCEC